ncbi:hypothetical protein F5Y01DRAFT_324936 [Xylaria sp. FL0043]|nr:hypothetical protein F5Y01DRAFT_324936 [Xylaria sp. FL0043]
MALHFKAFDLTVCEKFAALRQVRSLVLGAGALIARANAAPEPSPHDYTEALTQINKALFIATDPDACDPLLAPLATCYLYKGHILLALNCIEEARAAYRKAATSKTSNFVGLRDAGTNSQDEAKRLLRRLDQSGIAASRKKSSASAYRSGLVDGRPGALFMDIGPDGIELPITLRPGPAKCPARLRRVPGKLSLL